MFNQHKIFETTFTDRKLIVEVGKFAQLANGSCLVRYGETVVNVAATASSKPRENIDFLPLSVDFEERLYSVGKIPGSFTKREGRPSEKAVLASRIIDRPIRPLFPKNIRNDISVTCTVMSVDEDCSPEIAAMLGASVALSISDIPWDGPICGVQVGLVNNEIIINPTAKQRKQSVMSLTVASVDNLVAMIEAGASEVPDDIIKKSIMMGHTVNCKIISFIKNIQKEVGHTKFRYTSNEPSDKMYADIKNFISDDIKIAIDTNNKKDRENNLKPIYERTHEKFENIYPEEIDKIDECINKIQKNIVRNWLLYDKKRVDGRGIDEIRKLHTEVKLLPKTHGSGMFTRGQTQVLTTVTLGSVSDRQLLDGIDNEEFKRYMHHYNFPSYSVGETRPNRSPSRRDIGHGALAEKALLPVIPSVEEFPYALRLVSEVLSSNGSTSQASVCASSLALMDAGVPIKAPVAGISCGLVSQGDKWLTMVDIQGLEDFFGDMDFKVAGTKKGITAIQMDLKIHGLTQEIIEEALLKTKLARNQILEVMSRTIDKPNAQLSKYAPKVLSTIIPVDKIREVIGSGGRMVQKICTDFDVKIDIEEDGSVFVTGTDMPNCKNAMNFIKKVIIDPKPGMIFSGIVTKIMEFGAFVEISPGKEGLCHISQLSQSRTEKVTDELTLGQEVNVKVTGIDERGRINLSIKAALE